MEVARIIRSVNIRDLAAEIGVPLRTLQNWAEANRVTARRETERKLWTDKIERAAAKLRKAA